MEDLFKKFLYTSVGLVATTVEKFQSSVDQMVDEEKITHEEGKKIVDEFINNTEAKREEFESKLKHIVEEILGRLNLATSSHIQDLEDRIAALESLHKGDTAEKAATTSRKKAPTKKEVAEA